MTSLSRIALTVALLMTPLFASLAQAQPAGDRWREPYQGEDATGPDIIALWTFSPTDPTADGSSHDHTLTLRGEQTRTLADDRFGGILRITQDTQDKGQGAQAVNHDDFSPQGAFSGELWIRPHKDMVARRTSYLLDKKYFPYTNKHPRANRDFMFVLAGAEDKWDRALQLQLGFGEDSAAFTSKPYTFEPDQWYHVAFSYDGKGTAKLYVNGQEVGSQTHEGRGAMTPGPHALTVGDRVGSTYHRFTGSIAQVRLSRGVIAFTSGLVRLEAAPGRRVFQRMEKDAAIEFVISNETSNALNDITLRITSPNLPDRTIKANSTQPGQKRTARYEVDTTLAAGAYPLTIQLYKAGQPSGDPVTVDLHLANRYVPGQMPLVMWGGTQSDQLKALGFTHRLMYLAGINPIWSQNAPVEPLPAHQVQEQLAALDQLLLNQEHGLAYLSTIHHLRSRTTNEQNEEAALRPVDAQGKSQPNTIDPNFPRVRDFARNTGIAVGRTFGHHPALDGALIHSEVRDKTRLSWHEMNQQAYRQATGLSFPENIQGPRNTHYRTLKDFPADRIVPDDYPLLTFYRWFWKDGDGWNPLHTVASDGFKSQARPGVWTFFDPAVRAPSLYGSGGRVDYLSQWTYTYPDPIKVVLATDELRAMAKGRDGQDIMTMTQAIWYRSQTAPILKEDQKKTIKQAPWELEHPDARYITIAPDILRESLWLMLSQPVRGIMLHGMGSLVPPKPGERASSYVFTNDTTPKVLGDVAQEVVQPLGPTLLQVPARETDIAYLESFTSQMLAGRGSYGWGNGWSADAYLTLLWAKLHPHVIYEQTLLDKGLDSYKVLVLMDCDVLTRSVADAIIRWQDKGGIIIADERLAPAIQADILIPSYQRTRKAEADKAELQARARQIRTELDRHYQRYVDADNPDVIVQARAWQQSDYLFAINDHRTYGDYVGQHGLVMEKGLPSQANITLSRDQGVVYDVLASRRVDAVQQDDQSRWSVELEPGDGKLFLITPKAIDRLTLDGPATAKAGRSVTWKIRILDAQGKPIQAVLPLRVDVVDAAGNIAEFSGWHGAPGGEFTLKLDLPTNAAEGDWRIRVRELASGLTRDAIWQVTAR